MLKQIKFNILILFVFFAFNIFSQTYPFTNYTLESGLSQRQILCVYQDNLGVMWFGTSGGGITKFDGNTYETINDKNGLADNVVFCITHNKEGKILIGTYSGLSVYDPENKSSDIKQKIKNYSTKDGLGDNRIFSILMDENNNALLGTAKGVSSFKNNTCSKLKISNQIDSASVFSVYIDSNKHFWYSTLGNGVFYFDGKNTKNYTTAEGLENDMVFSVTEKSKNVFWFLTGEGLFELNNNALTHINPANIKDNATYYKCFKDKNNVSWIGTTVGLIKIDAQGKCVVLRKENGLVDNSIWNAFQDKEDNLWFVSDQNGASKLSSERFFMYTTNDGLLYNEIKRIHQNKNGEYVIGTKLGISISKNGKYTNYTYKELIGSADIWCITEDKNGNYYFGTPNGLLLYNGSSFKRITCTNKLNPMNTVFDVYIDNSNVVWLGTQAGVARVIDGYIQPYTQVAITKNYVNKIIQDNEGKFWFGTDDGLFKYSNNTLTHFTEKEGFTTKRVRGIAKDDKGDLWFATSNGVYKYSNYKFTNISEAAKLKSNDINSVIVDKKGNTWIGLETGIQKIQYENGKYKVKNYDFEDGFLGQECSQNGMMIDVNGRLNIASAKGLVVYQEEFDKENKLEPTTIINRIDLFFQETKWESFSDSVFNNIPQNLELPYNKNYLTFHFIGISHTKPLKVSYKYMMKGVDKDWRLSSKTEASYSNLPHGSYEFMVMANNGEGVWNKEPVVFKFTINPPFWRTWWFYSIILLIVLSGIYSYIKISNANKKILKQNEIIEEKNEALQHANIEIAEINRNITDSINYAKRIQQSFLTPEENITYLLEEYFILFKPRDIVSGDFYMAFDFPDRKMIVCADCTGHGIPGAFMSLIGISLLNEISRSNKLVDTSKVLEEIRSIIINALNPKKVESGGKDGMDVSLITIFKKEVEGKVKIHFSGANNSVHLLTEQNGEKTMLEFKGDKQPVGYYANMKEFTQHEILANKGDVIYMYTDGFADQFGGTNGKKFMSRQLKQLLISVAHFPLKKQKEYLEEAFVKWQGNLEQVDDVTVIGIRV